SLEEHFFRWKLTWMALGSRIRVQLSSLPSWSTTTFPPTLDTGLGGPHARNSNEVELKNRAIRSEVRLLAMVGFPGQLDNAQRPRRSTTFSPRYTFRDGPMLV